MKTRKKCHARLSWAGVDILADGIHLAGITDQEALDLQRSLKRLRPRIAKRVKQEGGRA